MNKNNEIAAQECDLCRRALTEASKAKGIFGIVMLMSLGGCASTGDWLSSSGPQGNRVLELSTKGPALPVIVVDSQVAHRVALSGLSDSFANALGRSGAAQLLVGRGDSVEVSIWESPPAMLFAANGVDPRGVGTAARLAVLPEQVVDAGGLIQVPFAGFIPAAGRTARQIEAEIVQRLSGKANQPQVLLRVSRNLSSTVTVVGEVVNATRMPLTPKGERLLDAVASAAGVRQPTDKVTIQLSRSGKVIRMPLEQVIQDPQQNVYLQADDVITALHQPYSFTSLGATGRNEEISFEAKGITLAQALGRMSGIRDSQADARGVFIFRYEDAEALVTDHKVQLQTAQGKVPVVYQVDLKDPRTFLAAQEFPMKNRDVVYVANAPAAELQKFLNILTSSIYSVSSLATVAK